MSKSKSILNAAVTVSAALQQVRDTVVAVERLRAELRSSVVYHSQESRDRMDQVVDMVRWLRRLEHTLQQADWRAERLMFSRSHFWSVKRDGRYASQAGGLVLQVAQQFDLSRIQQRAIEQAEWFHDRGLTGDGDLVAHLEYVREATSMYNVWSHGSAALRSAGDAFLREASRRSAERKTARYWLKWAVTGYVVLQFAPLPILLVL